MEDRIYAAGNGNQLSAACNKFNKSSKTRSDQNIFYDDLINCGATAEEADEFIDASMS